MNAIPISLLILAAAAVIALLIHPAAQRHLAAWLRARADRMERMAEHNRAERAVEAAQRAAYYGEMAGRVEAPVPCGDRRCVR